ncbi:MAG: CvpA family protein [Myxococcales bacterium]|nr:CvpA family protein [Myxococcales bacterium]
MTFDLALLALVFLFALWGAFRGLLRQILGLAGFVGGIVLARLFAGPFGDAFAKDIGLPAAIATAAMALAIFLAAEIVAKLVGNFLHKRMQGGFTGAVEKGGGFFLGFGKGLLVAWAVASLVALIRPHLQHMEKETSMSKLDLAHSHAISVAREVNLITELRAKPPGKS